jgi:hypothetical protein
MHRNHITPESIPEELTDFIIRRFDSIAQETDVPPIIICAFDPEEDISGPSFAFAGSRGLVSDLFDEHEPGQPGFVRPYEWVSHHEDLQLYEMLLLQDPDNGYWILVSANVVEQNESLKWVLTDPSQGGLSEPQFQAWWWGCRGNTPGQSIRSSTCNAVHIE